MFNNALELEEFIDNKGDITIFDDVAFKNEHIDEDDEKLFIKLQTIDLSEAKKLYRDLSISKKIMAMRYLCSRRIFESNLLSRAEKKELKNSYEESFGSLCAMDDKATETITLESQLITRLLYIAESMSFQEYHRMKHELVHVADGYYVIMQVIKSRLNFHKMTE